MSSHQNPSILFHPSLAKPSHPSSVTLASLSEYTNVQEQRIGSVLKNGFQPLEQYEPMVALWHSVWGKQELCLDVTEKIERDPLPDRVDNSLIDGIVPDEFDMMILPEAVEECWKIRCRNIFIRPNEYEEAEKAALVASQQPQCHRFLVTGQPGIGLFALHFPIM